MEINKDKLDKVLLEKWKYMMEGTLDVMQLVSLPSQWQFARAKTLRLMNNFLRELREEFDLELTTEKPFNRERTDG